MSQSKRILFLADVNSIHTERWVRNLVERGYTIAIFSLSAQTNFWTEDLDLQVRCAGFDKGITRSNKRFGKMGYFAAKKEALRLMNEVQPSIVHAHYASSYGMLAKRLKFPKTVLSMWGSDVYEFPNRSFLHKRLLKSVLKSVPVLCSTSKAMAKEAGKYTRKKIVITPFGIDVNRFVPQVQLNRTPLHIGTVKTLENTYGIDRLLKVFAQFQERQPAELHIYGDGSQRRSLEEQAKTLKLTHKVHFHGFVSGDELLKAYQNIDVFVALSRSESFGVAVLEAHACGLPALVSDVGGLPEVAHPELSRIISGDDIEAGVRGLEDLAQIETRTKAEKVCRTHILENFSSEACVERLIEEVYEQFS